VEKTLGDDISLILNYKKKSPMKSKVLFFFLLSLCISNTCLAQEDKQPKFKRYKELLGIWKLETVENEKTPIVMIIEFKKNGNFDLKSQDGLETGTYFPSEDKKSIKIFSKKGVDTWEIKKLNKEELEFLDTNPRMTATFAFRRIKKAEAKLLLPEKQ
jgi:hypothetical protein